MTNPQLPPLPDPRRILAKLTADVRGFEERAARTQQALAAASVEVDSEAGHLSLRMLGAHVTGIEFHEGALQLSPAQLAEELRRALVEGSARANRASADAVRAAVGDESVVRGIEDAVPEDVRQARDRHDAEAAATRQQAPGPAPEHLRPMTPQEQQDLLDSVLAYDDADDEPTDLAELARELDYHPSREAPQDMQAAFEAEMDLVKSRAAALPALMEQVHGVADSEAVEITVNAAGAITGTRFHAGFARAGAEELGHTFLATLAEAGTEARHRLQAELGSTGFAASADTLRGLGL